MGTGAEPVVEHRAAAVVVGGGGAGLYAAMELARGASGRVAVVSKLHPLRSHTGAALGGIAASLGNVTPDNWEWHMFDTAKGGAYLADQDAAEVLAREAPEVVIDLEHRGLPFDRLADGRIAQRQYGGHTGEFGTAPVPRSCYSADRTGHMILHTLYQQCMTLDVDFFDEFQVVELLIEERRCHGVLAVELATGTYHVFSGRVVVLATGGYGRIYDLTTNAVAATGDGPALVFRKGIPLQDMEFFQFHPTGVPGQGILISEAARGMGGHLYNGRGERFMDRYAPRLRELAPRDLVSRAIHAEVEAGRGVDGGSHVELHLMHLDPDELRRKLPDLVEHCHTYLGIDPTSEPIPVLPRAHYAMGGIPTDLDGRVRGDGRDELVDGLYAAGECACVSVHGANRLGTNSLLEILVFGRRAGRHAAEFAGASDDAARISAEAVAEVRGRTSLLLSDRPDARRAAGLRGDLQSVMGRLAGVARHHEGLIELVAILEGLRQEYREVVVSDRHRVFNQELLEAMELGNLIDVARAVAASGLHRRESRGSHFRADFPRTDDDNWLVHSLAFDRPHGVAVDTKPVVITRFKPDDRAY